MASSDGIGNIAHDFNFLRQVAPIPEDIQDRRVEITGPVDRKMVINALNSGANVYMADFEDSNAPTWCAGKGSFTPVRPSLALALDSQVVPDS